MISDKLKLDDIDRRIITLVQDDPNLTHTQIAAKIDRSQPTRSEFNPYSNCGKN